MRRLKKILLSPLSYAIWALFVFTTLAASYFADPYFFAFTTLIMGAITIGIGFVGFTVALLSKGASQRTRTSIIVLVALAAAAVAAALAILGSFHWA